MCHHRCSWTWEGYSPSAFDYDLARDPLKKMGIAVDDVKKVVRYRGCAVELRAGASEPHKTQPDYISKLHLPIPFHQQLGDDDTKEECVKLSAAWGLYHYNRDVANDLNKMSTSQTNLPNKVA